MQYNSITGAVLQGLVKSGRSTKPKEISSLGAKLLKETLSEMTSNKRPSLWRMRGLQSSPKGDKSIPLCSQFESCSLNTPSDSTSRSVAEIEKSVGDTEDWLRLICWFRVAGTTCSTSVQAVIKRRARQKGMIVMLFIMLAFKGVKMTVSKVSTVKRKASYFPYHGPKVERPLWII